MKYTEHNKHVHAQVLCNHQSATKLGTYKQNRVELNWSVPLLNTQAILRPTQKHLYDLFVVNTKRNNSFGRW